MCEVLDYYKNMGMEQGIEQGENKKELALTVKMLEKSFPEEMILSLGITKEQIEKAKNGFRKALNPAK